MEEEARKEPEKSGNKIAVPTRFFFVLSHIERVIDARGRRTRAYVGPGRAIYGEMLRRCGWYTPIGCTQIRKTVQNLGYVESVIYFQPTPTTTTSTTTTTTNRRTRKLMVLRWRARETTTAGGRRDRGDGAGKE